MVLLQLAPRLDPLGSFYFTVRLVHVLGYATGALARVGPDFELSGEDCAMGVLVWLRLRASVAKLAFHTVPR